eukprot:2330852-Amphidinium_carterae.1
MRSMMCNACHICQTTHVRTMRARGTDKSRRSTATRYTVTRRQVHREMTACIPRYMLSAISGTLCHHETLRM